MIKEQVSSYEVNVLLRDEEEISARIAQLHSQGRAVPSSYTQQQDFLNCTLRNLGFPVNSIDKRGV